jgi:hypothetical protein
MFRSFCLTAAAIIFAVDRIPAQTFTRITDTSNPVVTDQYESGGGTWFDANNDGFLDLFVSNGNLSSVNNSFYLNDTNGGFRKVIVGPVVTDGGSSIGSTVGDYNADGNPDLFVTNRQNFGNFLYMGTGDSALVKITSGQPVTDIANSNSSSWVDVDNDGDLDLFTVNFQGNNYLYRNSGAPAFTLTRVDTGSIVTDGSNFSIPGAWADYNNDRRPDLFIGNAGTQNDVLYTNAGNGAFIPQSFSDGKASLGASWGDYDNDGDLDLFVSSFLNQKSYLYRNAGAPGYAMVRIDTGIVCTDAGNSVGSVWTDIDNDGDLDLFVANDGQNNFLYRNSGYPEYIFTKITAGAVVSDGGNSFGCSSADYDNDGDMDLFVANRLDQKNFLYANDGNANHWITIAAKGTSSNRSGIGTKVRLRSVINGHPLWQMQEVAAQTGYNSQNLLLHFGLGNASVIDSLIIEWPSGRTELMTGLSVDTIRTFTEGTGPLSVNTGAPAVPNGSIILGNFPNPFNPSTTITYTIPSASDVRLELFDALGRSVTVLVDQFQQAGTFRVPFSAESASHASGLYLCRLTSGSLTTVKKLMLMK